MSPQRRDKSALPDPSYQWTTLKAEVFLAALARLGRVDEAAAFVGMSRQSAYRLRARLGPGGAFATGWDRALSQARAARTRTLRKAPRLPAESDRFGIGR